MRVYTQKKEGDTEFGILLRESLSYLRVSCFHLFAPLRRMVGSGFHLVLALEMFVACLRNLTKAFLILLCHPLASLRKIRRNS